MRRTVLLALTVLLLVPALMFAGGQKEGTQGAAAGSAAAGTDDSGKELGVVINRPFEMIAPRDDMENGSVVIERFKAAPELKAKVEAGELPPVDERIPEEPLVLQPIESVGKYGGWMRTLRFPVYIHTLSERLMLEHLVTWSMPDFKKLNPNVAKAWDISADGKTTTFYLREGMKWSDGTPFTSEAITWWFEHIIKNNDLYPSKPAFLLTRGNLPTVTAIDDTTVQFKFTDPSPMFLEYAARIRPMPYAPGHYLEQFHPDFISKEQLDKLVKDGEYDTWMAMFNDKKNFYTNPDIPSISGWVPLNPGTEEVAKFGRNPYYWKTDTEGNQLPYIDGMDHPFVQDAEAWLLQTMAGELTYAASGFIGGRPNLPLLLENQERGGYKIAYNTWPPNNLGYVALNFGHPDPVKRQLIEDRRFRMALLKAIDYDTVNQVIYEGEAVVSWPASSDHLGQDHELYSRYIGQDLDQANALLDEMGLTRRDNEGFRLGPDGKPLTLISLTDTAWPTESAEIQELYRGYWEDIGLRVVGKVQSGQLASQMRQAGEYDFWIGSTAPGGRPMNLYDRGALMPASPTWIIAQPWAQWLLTDGREGVEPPQWMKRLREIQIEGMVEPSAATRDAYIEEALEIWVENILVIPGYNQPHTFSYMVYKENLGNFAVDTGKGYMAAGAEHHITPSQLYYFK